MTFLPILLSKIKLHHVSELGVTCWVGWVCPTLGIILTQSASALVNVVYGPSSNFLLPSVHIYTKIWGPSLIHVRG